MKRSLVGRLALSFLLPSIVVLCLLALVAYFQTRTTLRESLFDKLNAMATLKAGVLDLWVDNLFRDTVFLSKLSEVAALAATLADEEEAAPRREEAYSRLSQTFRQVLDDKPSIAEIFMLSPVGGKILISTEKSREEQYRIYDLYYVEGKRAPFVQNVYPSPVTLKPTLTISAPVRAGAGETIAVLALHLSLDHLDQNVLRRTGLGRSGAVILVDQHKILVTGSRYGEPAQAGGVQSLAVEEVIQGKSGTALYSNLETEPVIGAYRWLEDRKLGLIVEISQEEAYRPARRLAIFVVLVGSLFVATLVGVVYLVARRIARPILAVADAASRVSAGDLDARAPVATRDEIGVLAGAFNRMVGELAGLNAEMSTQISQLEQAKREREELIAELETKNAELERFTYTVSHDLKSPLVTIRGFLGFLEKDIAAGDEERAQRDMKIINEATDKMRELLEELLELSRIGRVVNPPEELSFRGVALEAVNSVAGGEEGERAEIEVAEDLPVVYGDRVRVREVVENLVVNALRFMGDQPAPRVEIGAREVDGESVLFVRDNGIGIDPRFHDKIFGLFERLDPGVDGTGIGLAIVRRIVEVHGGRVWVESEGEGRGSTFCLTLPGKPETG